MGKEPAEIKQIALKEQVTYLIARLNARLTAQAVRILRETSDLSLSQWRLMAVIDSQGPISMAEFIRFTEFDKGQTSRVASDLLRRGFLSAQEAENSKRIQILSFTPLGRAAFDAAAVRMKQRREFMVQALSPAEHVQLQVMVDKLNAACDRFEGGA